MRAHHQSEIHKCNKHSIFTWPSAILSVVVGVASIVGIGFVDYQLRLNFASLMLAFCGGCYVNGPFGKIETVAGSLFFLCAFIGLYNPLWIGFGWLLHGISDTFHHYADYPLVHWVWFSSLGCAIIDPMLAIYFFMGAPTSIF